MDKALKREENVFLGRPISRFAQVEKVISDSLVEVSYYKDDTYTDREFATVAAHLVRKLDDVGYKDQDTKPVKKKRMSFAGKGKKAVKEFNQSDMDSVMKDLL